jgi:hypothetical protein
LNGGLVELFFGMVEFIGAKGKKKTSLVECGSYDAKLSV